MRSIKILTLMLVTVLTFVAGGYGADDIIVLRFDCQGDLKYLTKDLADSLAANLKILRAPAVSRNNLETAIARKGYSENDLNYNPSRLAGLVAELNAKGAVYGQVYKKDGLIVLNSHYIETGNNKPIDFDPMIGFSGEDILEMTWDLAVILSHDDKTCPQVVSVSPSDSALVSDDRAEITICFDEPMNPDSYCLTGEPKDMFFVYGEVEYDPKTYCFEFKVHLYPDMNYEFWVNGPGLKPFKDTTGNVAGSYNWRFKTD